MSGERLWKKAKEESEENNIKSKKRIAEDWSEEVEVFL